MVHALLAKAGHHLLAAGVGGDPGHHPLSQQGGACQTHHPNV